jgi:hypothetical protein
LAALSKVFSVAKLPHALPRGSNRHNAMSDDRKFQLRLNLSDEFAQVARNDPEDPSIS